MNRIKTSIEDFLKRKMTPHQIEKYFLRTSEERVSAKHSEIGEPYQVSCVQREIILSGSIEEYIERMESFVQEASNNGSEIVVFPEYNVFDLLGIIPGFKFINNYLNKKAKKSSVHKNGISNTPKELLYEAAPTSRDARFISLFEVFADPSREALLKIMSMLAKKYGIYIYSGTYILKEENKLYNAGSLIDRDGDVLGTQKKVHLTDFEDGLQFSREENIQVFNLDFARTAIPVCMDASYFETFMLAKNADAELVIIPIANNEEYSENKALRGIWPRVQESYLFGLKSSLNGWLGGMHFTGKAGIFAPVDYTYQQNGLISISSHYEGNELVSGELNRDKLNRVRVSGEYIGDINPVFEEDYYQKTYIKEH